MELPNREENLLGPRGRGSGDAASSSAIALRGEIIYAAVAATQDRILVQHAFVDGSGRRLGGNIHEVTASYLKHFDNTVVGTLKTYVLEDHCWHYMIDANSGRWYVCWAAKDMGRRLPSIFLEEVRNQFEARQYNAAQLQRPGLQRTQEEFGKEIQALLEKFNDRSVHSVDRLTAMTAKARGINDNLMDSLAKLLERQEKIELLVHRTEELSNSSNSFRRVAREVRNRAWWQEKKAIACFILVLLCAIMLIVFSVCGITFSECRSR
jgi:hypothetical protein